MEAYIIQKEVPESTRLSEVALLPLCERFGAGPQVTRGIPGWSKSPRETDKGDETASQAEQM